MLGIRDQDINIEAHKCLVYSTTFADIKQRKECMVQKNWLTNFISTLPVPMDLMDENFKTPVKSLRPLIS